MLKDDNNTNASIWVERVIFKLNGVELDGYSANEVDENGIPIFYMSSRGAAESIGNDKTTAVGSRMSKELKTALGEDFTVVRGKYKQTSGGVTKIDLWRTKYINKYYWHYARRGNETALDILMAMSSTTLDLIIADAFGLEYKRHQAEQWTNARLIGKEVRRSLTDAIKDYLDSHNVNNEYRKWVYSNATDSINTIVFNRRASKLKIDWRVSNPRDGMTARELEYVKEVEDLTTRLIDKGMEPLNAVKEAGRRLVIPIQERAA